jgi:hypothetical protein
MAQEALVGESAFSVRDVLPVILSAELLQEPRAFWKAFGLKKVVETVNSFVQERQDEITAMHVIVAANFAKRCGISEREILDEISKAITLPQFSDPNRVQEIRRLLLSPGEQHLSGAVPDDPAE